MPCGSGRKSDGLGAGRSLGPSSLTKPYRSGARAGGRPRRAARTVCALLPLPAVGSARLSNGRQAGYPGSFPSRFGGARAAVRPASADPPNRTPPARSPHGHDADPRLARSRRPPVLAGVPRRHLARGRHRERPRGAGGRQRRVHAGIRPRPHPQEREAGVRPPAIRPHRLRGRGLGRLLDRSRRRRAGRARDVPGRQGAVLLDGSPRALPEEPGEAAPQPRGDRGERGAPRRLRSRSRSRARPRTRNSCSSPRA
jgi:hypothetical protein